MFECLLAYREIFEAWGLSGQDVERLEREQVAYEEAGGDRKVDPLSTAVLPFWSIGPKDKKRLTSVKEQIKQSETLLVSVMS